MGQGDQIAAYIRTLANVKAVLWRVKNHFDHVHFDTWPTGIGKPPCKGGALRVQYEDGTIGRTFKPVTPPSPPPIIDEDMYAAVQQGDKGQAVEAWQRVMQQIDGFKPPAWGVFGPETTGLSAEELALCGRCVRIPSHEDQPSLNLSHAVMVAAYEVFRAGRRSAPGSRRATSAEKERLLVLLREGLIATSALPAVNTDGYFQEWQAIFARADLTPKEVRLLEHMARKMAQAGRRTAAAGTAEVAEEQA
jgi:hypothetical protein